MTTISTSRSASELLIWSRGQIEPVLRAAVDRLPGVTRHISGYHFGWWDEQGRPTEGSGKAIRPALLLLASGTTGSAENAAQAAAAVELVHNFTLLHDDVMDRDLTRRHRPTAWSVFGAGQAILAGDALLTLAFELLGHSRAAIELVGETLIELVGGQSTDLAFEHETDVHLTECVNMAAAKTGALLGCACALGALFGGGSAAQIAQLRGFGRHLGLAFQLVDDLLGIWGQPDVTGKPVHSDLANRKKSLPVVAALTSGSAAGRELAKVYHTEGDLAHLAGLVETAGGRAWAQTRAEEELTQALSYLDAAGLAAHTAAELRTLARLVTRRDH